ncbi:MAG: hypothetical protein R3A79_18880 [Nannocystaceae bacterium]
MAAPKLDTDHVRNVGEFYSQHYLDAVLAEDLKELLKRWKARAADGGPKPPQRRLSALAEPYFRAMAAFQAEDDPEAQPRICAEFHALVLEALGYTRRATRGLLGDGVEIPLSAALDRHGRPYLWIGEASFPISDDDADPLGTAPLEIEAREPDADPPDTRSWRELLDGPLLRQEHAPNWVLLLAGPDVFLINRDKWPLGQYLHFELGAMLGHRKPSALRAFAGLLHREVLLPEDGQSLLEQIDERSHKHAFAVSTDLKWGVQRSIELIGNEVVWHARNVAKTKVFDRPELAAQLSRECITYLYRLLFLFFAEARAGEAGAVPMKADAYRVGLSLESLRDLELVPLTTERARNGYFIHHSLTKLFSVVHLGWPQASQRSIETEYLDAVDLVIPPQRSPLFDKTRTPLITAAKLRNHVLQEVIQLLSLSREGRRSGSGVRQRGRISYATLGINQLGAVYEGLLSYTGFFAEETTYELQDPAAKDDDARVFFVPASRAGEFEEDEFRRDEHGAKITHPKGTFLFRLAGRDREKSASYYTPEVLTQCLTKYTLRERLGVAGEEGALRADAILDLTICEPAMGSGAFLGEAVSQLAHAYLDRKQAELGELIPAEDYARELARVKYHFVHRRCYGVDLNPLAAELGKVSLWLGVLQPGVQAPFLDLRLRVGNSLIGARREVYAAADLLRKPNKRTGAVNWLSLAPTRLAPGEARPKGSIYHFLVPAAGMAPYEKDKVVKKLCAKEITKLKAWRKAAAQPFTKIDVARLEGLCQVIDDLWAEHARIRERLLKSLEQPVPLWRQPPPPEGARWRTAEESELSARELYKPRSPGTRLKAVMDLWCSLWSWPIEEVDSLPSRESWFAQVEALLTKGPSAEASEANAGRFLHWELEFPEVLGVKGGGFDVILGNPPWIKLSWNEAGILSDLEPLLAVRKLTAKKVADRRAEVLSTPHARREYLADFATSAGHQSYLNAPTNYPLLKGVQANLYKIFLVRGMELASREGATGMLHQPGIFDDPRGGRLREHLLSRARLVARFKNSLFLFSEIHDLTQFCISTLQNRHSHECILSSNLLHPSTLDGSYRHDGIGPVPGIRDNRGHWDLRPHRSRLVKVDADVLALFARLYDPPGTPPEEARLPVVHSQEILSVLRRFADAPRKLADLEGEYFCTEHFHETNQQKDGTIRRETRFPKDAGEWVVSGPHFFVGTPFNKTPNEGCKHNQDYSVIDLTEIREDYLPRTNYVPGCSPAEYRERAPTWGEKSASQFYRHAHREMVAPTNERTLVPAVYPPGIAHVNTVFSVAFRNEATLLEFSGVTLSIVADFFIKSTGMGHVNRTLSEQLPVATGPAATPIRDRTLRLNCLTTHYADLWNRNLPPAADLLPSAKAADPRCAGWEKAPRTWCWEAPLRTPYARRQALVELDALAALSLGMTLDELLLIYRVQFPVLQQYERETFYDQRGKIVFTVNRGLSGVGVSRREWEQIKDAKAGDSLPEWARDAGGPFVPPFDGCDREEDMAQAYAYFKERLPEAAPSDPPPRRQRQAAGAPTEAAAQASLFSEEPAPKSAKKTKKSKATTKGAAPKRAKKATKKNKEA